MQAIIFMSKSWKSDRPKAANAVNCAGVGNEAEESMFQTIEEFMGAWKRESDGTGKIMGALTDESLKQQVAEGHRNLGRMAWHIIGSIPEMMNRTGLEVRSPKESDPVPTSAAEIIKAYDTAVHALTDQITAQWTDESLQVEDDMYGATWKRGLTLGILMNHEIHHRGQMTVLMRQAGLPVPGVYGPSKEEWVDYKMEPPAV
jgi:uncharacterized damage-inducible protein DinB